MAIRAVLFLCLALLAAPGCSEEGGQDVSAQVQVLVVPIEGEISLTTVALVRRALREARSYGISRVVLEIDTPGGRLDSMLEVGGLLGAALRENDVYTVGFVRSQALSAGAYIALACRETFMASGSTIGAITPVVMGLDGITQIPDDDARSKIYAAIRADVRALLERRGSEGSPYSEDALRIAEAMVDPSIRLFKVTYEEGGFESTEVLDADALRVMENRTDVTIVGSPEPVSTSHPAVLTAREAEEWGLSSGVVANRRELVRDHFHLTEANVHEMEMSWSETAVDLIEGFKLFLFLFGFILLVVELKTPGFAVPGVLGVLLLGLGMFGSYLVGLAQITEILLFFLGLAAVAVEIFILPGTIVFGALGFICVVASLILSQQTFIVPATVIEENRLVTNLGNMLLLVVGLVAATTLLRKFLPQIPILNRVLLNPPDRQLTGDSTRFAAGERGERLKALIGRVGRAETTLRPSGVLELDGDRMDVVTEGDFIEAGTEIRILQVEGNRIVVGAVTESAEADPGDRGEEGGEVSLGLLILLVIIGFAMVVAEVFFVSFGVLSALAAVCLISSIFLAFQRGQAFGIAVLVIAAAGVPTAIYFALKWLPNTPMGRRLLLSAPDRDTVTKAAEEPGLHEFLHKTGVALSPLRPAGFARIAGRRVDVVTRGELLNRDCPLQVVQVEGNRVVVAMANAAAEADVQPPSEPPASKTPTSQIPEN